jgi:diguanylate cyclase (GGDEF)-like protein
MVRRGRCFVQDLNRAHARTDTRFVEGTLERTALATRRDLYAAVDAAALSGRAWTVMLVDLDRFSRINQEHGRAVGDVVLLTVAERLRACVTASDAVARLGADEFGVLVVWPGRPQVARLALDLIGAVERPIPVFGSDVEVGCTLGIGDANPGALPIEVLEAAERDRDARKAHRREAHVTTLH